MTPVVAPPVPTVPGVVRDEKYPIPAKSVPAIPIPVEKIPVIPVDEHHPAVPTEMIVPVVDDVKASPEKVFVDTAKVFTTALYRLQTFERTYMANPFPVDEHFRQVFDSMVKLGVIITLG